MEDTIMNTQKLIKKLKRLNELTEDALCREWLHKLSDYEHKQFVEKANALKEEIASLEQEQDDKDKTAEEVLQEVYMEHASPVEFKNDKTAWKKIALIAMERYASQVDRKNRTTEQDDKDKTAEEILRRECNYPDNDIMEDSDDITVGEALEAMQEYASQEVRKSNIQLRDKMFELLDNFFKSLKP